MPQSWSEILASIDALEPTPTPVGQSAASTEPQKTILADSGVVAVRGDEAETFLHAQFSADCQALPNGSSLLTAWCSPKGRVLFLLRLVRSADNEFYILLPREQAASFCKRLSMFVLRAKVSIDDLSEHCGVIRITGCDAIYSALEGTIVGANDGPVQWLIGPPAELSPAWPELPGVAVSLADAIRADIRAGVPALAATLSDEFLPQELNLDLTDGVNFNKGCYPGQEIIARVKFRGSVKRRLAHLRSEDGVEPEVGQRLVDGDSPVGTVLASVVNSGQGAEILAVLAVDPGSIQLAGSTTTVNLITRFGE